jgi:hypothetical protein
MPRISQYQRKIKGDERVKMYASLFFQLIVCDMYVLTKKNNDEMRLVAYKGIFKQEFVVKSEFDLPQKLGDWLCSLNKEVYNR